MLLREHLEEYTKEQMSLFRKACEAPQDISVNEVMDSVQLHIYWLGNFEEVSDRFSVFDAVSAGMGKQLRRGISSGYTS